MTTKIAWTDEVWNPTVGCSRVSVGCEHCYAERMAARGMTEAHRGLTKDGHWTGEVRCLPERLEIPLHWRKPRRVFVDSMSDLFHPAVPDEFIDRVFWVMRFAPKHTFQVLTKRPGRMSVYTPQWVREFPGKPPPRWPLPNVWLGTTAENQATADDRIPHLLQTPAAVRFLSLEPLLGLIEELDSWFMAKDTCGPEWPNNGIHWVIVGGESGPGARPCDVQWIRSVVQQCQTAEVPVFIKQLGSYVVAADVELADWPTAEWRGDPGTGRGRAKLFSRAGADPAEWPEDLRVQQFPEPPA